MLKIDEYDQIWVFNNETHPLIFDYGDMHEMFLVALLC